MALGKAFIEVHADLSPFKKDLGGKVAAMVKDTQAAIDKAVREAVEKGSAAGDKSGGGKVITPKIKPSFDTTDVDKGSGRISQMLTNAFTKSVGNFGASFTELVSSGQLYNNLTAGLVIGLAAVSPLIAASIAGAISLGIGLAGIGAGIALAFRDSRIKQAATALGDQVMEGLSRVSGVFLVPVMRAIEKLGLSFNNFLPRIERSFAALAPYVDSVVNGVTGFVDAIGPGLEAALSNSGPFLAILAQQLPVIGDALGYFFEEITSNQGAQAGLVGFFHLMADAIIVTTNVLTFLSDIFRAFVLVLAAIPTALIPKEWELDIQELVAGLTATSNATNSATGQMLSFGQTSASASQQTKDLTRSLNDFFAAELAATNANIAFEAGIDAVAAAFKGAKDNIDITTQKGRENVTLVNQSIDAAIRNRDAIIKQTGSVKAGNDAYNTQISKLRGVLSAAGLTKAQIEKLIGAYDNIPPEVTTKVAVPGLAAALNTAQELARTLSSIRSQQIQTRRAGSGGAGVGGYADGGVVRQEQLAWVGEGNRAEAIIPLTNPGRAAQVMAEAGLTGLGGGTITVQLILDGKVIDERIVRTNQSTARTLGQQPRTLI